MKVEELQADYLVAAATAVDGDAWPLVPLGELGQWSGGGTPSKTKAEFWENGTIPWVSPKDMKSEHITDSEDRITDAAVKGSAARLIPEGSVLIVTRSGILRHTLPVAVATMTVTVNQDLKALTPKEGILPEYVAWALRCFAQEILNTCSKQGTTVNSIETSALKAFEIPLAPLDQQKRIVAEIEKQFSRLDEAVANLKRVKANLKRYKAAVLKAAVEGRLVETEAELARREGRIYETGEQLLLRILETRRSQWKGKGKYKEPAAPDTSDLPELPEGWVWATVSQVLVAPILNGLSIKESASPTEVRALRLSAMSDGGFDYNDNRFLPVPLDDVADIIIRESDFFVSRGSGSLHLVGRATVAQVPPFDVIFPDTMMRLRLTEEIRATSWLKVIWPSRLIRRQIEEVVKTTAGIYKISQKELSSMFIPLPPSVEQHRIATEVDRRLSIVRAIDAQLYSNSRRTQRLRQAILSTAFCG